MLSHVDASRKSGALNPNFWFSAFNLVLVLYVRFWVGVTKAWKAYVGTYTSGAHSLAKFLASDISGLICLERIQ